MDLLHSDLHSPAPTPSFSFSTPTTELSASQLQVFVSRLLSTMELPKLCSLYHRQLGYYLPLQAINLSSIDPRMLYGEQVALNPQGLRLDRQLGSSGSLVPDHPVLYYFTRSLGLGEVNLLDQLHALFAQQLKQALAFTQLKQLATKDTLTGLGNRTGFNEASTRLISRAIRYGEAFSLLVIDLDNFKQVNDTQGHQEGDVVLEKVAGLLASSLRGEDEAFRFGGDEFCCLLDCVSDQCIDMVAGRIQQQIGQDNLLKRRNVSCSIGGATYRAGDDINSLFDRADGALYDVKLTGKNAFRAA